MERRGGKRWKSGSEVGEGSKSRRGKAFVIGELTPLNTIQVSKTEHNTIGKIIKLDISKTNYK